MNSHFGWKYPRDGETKGENNVKGDSRQKVHKLKLRETLTTFMRLAPEKKITQRRWWREKEAENFISF